VQHRVVPTDRRVVVRWLKMMRRHVFLFSIHRRSATWVVDVTLDGTL